MFYVYMYKYVDIYIVEENGARYPPNRRERERERERERDRQTVRQRE